MLLDLDTILSVLQCNIITKGNGARNCALIALQRYFEDQNSALT
jgi:hypothetical protein